MDSSGHFNERYAPNDAPVLFTMTHQKGTKASQENNAWGKAKGKEEGSTLKGKVRQLSGVGGTGKASEEETRHALHHPMERYGKGASEYSLFEEKKEEAKNRTGCSRKYL